MTKITTITCALCDTDITKDSKAIVAWTPFYDDLTHVIHFCSLEHMWQYFDERKKSLSDPAKSDNRDNQT